ncbi:methyl-accepting chemotaxis protein [Romboutsia lituseburensis]|uniref:methyl-accepting chemotaxis protein n=1 Tax=Romboutsia lituseburensis TaxID=1537 RepID=UPI00215A64B1|nr:methyl-accepting chemotaxis protein [Romboutsia lituseburensis]MCR8746748.1 methyl-accepting chemotaxis protein [Romboutsia lituseburensis]
MKNLKIGKKLSISFAILIIMAACASVYATFNLTDVKKANKNLFEGPFLSTTEAMGVRRDLVSIVRHVNDGFLSQDHAKARTVIIQEFDSINKRMEVLYKALPPEDQNMIDELASTMDQLRKEYDKMYAITQSAGFTGKESEVDAKTFVGLINKCTQEAIDLNEHAEKTANEYYNKVQKTIVTVIITFSIISVMSILIGIFVSIYMTRSLKNPIEELEIAADKMSDGDFDIDIEYESKDELGSLSDSMRKMSNKTKEIIDDTVRVLEEFAVGNLNVKPNVEYIGVFERIENSIIRISKDMSETMAQINVAAEEVGAASDQVASGSQMLSQGATEQASSIQELSATIMDISEKIKNTANNAGEANRLTLMAGREVEDGNAQMKQMVNAMEEISFTSNEIGRIIKTIDDIAFQTNILALNAAVEAARAGNAGKGFAVVADEVRNLAAKSAEAAKNTATLIENSIKAVDNGTEIVNYTAQSLQKIIETTNQTKTLVDEIAGESEAQATAIAEVTLGVEQISAVVQTNSATSEESAAASEELSGQAQMLKSLIEKFKLNSEYKDCRSLEFTDKSYFSTNE